MLWLLLALLAPPAEAATCRVTDGDSLVCGQERVRIAGLDTPELHGRCPQETALARQARSRMRSLVARGVTLHPQGRDRYGRLLAVVVDARGTDVARIMIAEGLARPSYHGEHRRGWCGR
ncbi:thermonuclease family protein [Falsiroseomonas sp. HW251]|uniref:thermonuclease family protein n=1 Tax=Falsiroseomonas sp. HW251 TaxID=3390998 RepID=UPI003D31C694